jgi:hypothetical protein
MKKNARTAGVPYNLIISLLIRQIHTGEISELVRLSDKPYGPIPHTSNLNFSKMLMRKAIR